MPDRCVDLVGIISACAEQTLESLAFRRSQPDHLRVCGADPRIVDNGIIPKGSSPRVRSRPLDLLGALRVGGIISACAEQTRRPVL